MDTHRRLSGRWLAVGLVTAVFVASAVLPWTPFAGRTICLFLHVTGLPCPGCGLGRSFVALTHGAWADALAAHPLGPVVYLLLAVLLVRLLVGALRRTPWRPWLPPRLRWPAVWLGVAAVVLTWAARLLGVLPGPPAA